MTITSLSARVACCFICASALSFAAPNDGNMDTAIKAQQRKQLEELKTISEQIDALFQKLQPLKKQLQPTDKLQKTQAQKSPQNFSPMDREAMNSPIFVAGGAPRPANKSNYSPPYRNNNKAGDNKDNPYNAKDGKTSDKASSDTNDTSSTSSSSSYGNPYSNSNYNNNNYYPSNNSSNFKATISSNNGNYSYTVANSGNDFISPFVNASSDKSLRIKFTGKSNGGIATYTKIQFCNPQYASCADSQGMSDSGITISNDILAGYAGSYQESSVSGFDGNYFLGKVYAKITDSNNNTSNIQFIFPAANCSKGGSNNLNCSISSSSSVSASVSST